MKIPYLVLLLGHCIYRSRGSTYPYCASACCESNGVTFRIKSTSCSDSSGNVGTVENAGGDSCFRLKVMKSDENGGLTLVGYRQEYQTEENLEPSYERLILFHRDDKKEIYDINLETKKIHRHPVSLRRARAATYLPRSRAVLVSEGIVRVVSKFLVGGDNLLYNKSVFLRHKVNVLAADESSGLIFYLNIHTIRHVNLQGENATSVYHPRRFNINNFIIDPTTKRLIIPASATIMIFDYRGKSVTVVDGGRSMYAIAFDFKENVLYYNAVYAIERRKVSGEGKTKIALIPKSLPKDMIIYKGKLYVAGSKNVYEVGGLTANSTVVSIVDSDQRLVPCLI